MKLAELSLLTERISVRLSARSSSAFNRNRHFVYLFSRGWKGETIRGPLTQKKLNRCYISHPASPASGPPLVWANQTLQIWKGETASFPCCWHGLSTTVPVTHVGCPPSWTYYKNCIPDWQDGSWQDYLWPETLAMITFYIADFSVMVFSLSKKIFKAKINTRM